MKKTKLAEVILNLKKFLSSNAYVRKKNAIFRIDGTRDSRGRDGLGSINAIPRHVYGTRFEGSSSKPDFLRFTFTDARRTKERTQQPRHDGPALNFLVHGVDGKEGKRKEERRASTNAGQRNGTKERKTKNYHFEKK